MTVLNYDDITDFKSVAHFPEYAKILFDKCYKDTNDNEPGSSKSNKVKWANIVQLKFTEENRIVKNNVPKVHFSFLLLYYDY